MPLATFINYYTYSTSTWSLLWNQPVMQGVQGWQRSNCDSQDNICQLKNLWTNPTINQEIPHILIYLWKRVWYLVNNQTNANMTLKQLALPWLIQDAFQAKRKKSRKRANQYTYVIIHVFQNHVYSQSQ